MKPPQHRTLLTLCCTPQRRDCVLHSWGLSISLSVHIFTTRGTIDACEQVLLTNVYSNRVGEIPAPCDRPTDIRKTKSRPYIKDI